MNGASWTAKSGWLATDTPCSWSSVIYGGGHVQILNLNDHQRSGSIPIEIGDFLFLKRLSISNNEITGTIPVEFGSLPDLEYIYLTDHQLTGPIPTESGSAANLLEGSTLSQ